MGRLFGFFAGSIAPDFLLFLRVLMAIKMPEQSVTTIVKSRLYSLREIENVFHVRCDEIIRSASESQVSVCVLVPPGRRVYHFELDNLDWDLTDYDVERVFRRGGVAPAGSSMKSDPWSWPHIAGASTLALVVDSRTCKHVYLFGYQRRRFFRSALQFYEGPVIGRGQVILIRPLQEFIDLPDDVGPEKEFPSYRLGVYGDRVRFDENCVDGILAPEELHISADSLYIVGEQLEVLLGGLNPELIFRREAVPAGVVFKAYPQPNSSITVPAFASSRLKAFSDAARSHWEKVGPGRPQVEYDEINRRLIDDLRAKKSDIPLAEDELEIAAGIVRPLWAQRGLSPEIKESRSRTYVTPDFEKIILVAHRVNDWKKSLAKSEGSRSRYGRPHPSNKQVIEWLSDSEHFSVSATHKAPVAAKLLRSVPGARRARPPAKPKTPKKKKE